MTSPNALPVIDCHHHIWRLDDLPWLSGEIVPRIFGPYEPIQRDYLIGEYDRRAGCTSTLTFDRRLARTDGFERPDNKESYPSQVSEP